MLVFAGKEPAAAVGAESAPGAEARDIYERHADGLYRQAVLTLGDSGAAGGIVADVLIAEYARSQVPGDDAAVGRRLAVSVYWRCQWAALGADRPGVRERGALALVRFGGLDYRQASAELAIAPAEMAALLRTALHRLDTATG
jgi:hypothetical protein